MTAETQNVTPNMDDEETAKAPIGLIILVVALGIAILGMLALMAYKIMSGDASKPKKQPVAVTTTVADPVEIGELKVIKPEGAKLSKVETTATSIVIHYQGDGVLILVIIDRLTGRESRITIPE